MHHIVLCRPLHRAGMAILQARGDVRVTVLDAPDKATLYAACADAHAVLAWLEPMDAAFLEAAPSMRCVARYGVGFDTVDLAACTARHVAVMVANGSNDLSVAEHAMMLMLAVARRAVDNDRAVKSGIWTSTQGPLMGDLGGRAVLVVGYGRIGARVARYCAAFGMKVSVMDPGFRPERIAADGFLAVRDLHAGLAAADVVTLHCPLRPETRHLMDGRAFAAMKPGAILVNTARGPVVVEAALVTALRSGRLLGAGLDVLEQEPPAPDNPLFGLSNVVISPHNAASTDEGLGRMAAISAQNMLDALDGRPDPAMVVNLAVLPGAPPHGA
ncbi:D-3-phosphoglycerate dehydrogenase [Humitalea rosea]|uniref:D-3-phosphoglycerate dehydrogenase n=1 Tax=Humitalea rosea TaxID=990373 RepID=A0A2W7IW21_9PROT|nr:hydroxyacid dehydrogenase [Humitalea rosea]PZW50958.1 D-3-phosphoglycerate dehydrogenase [Humitalea rosea]